MYIHTTTSTTTIVLAVLWPAITWQVVEVDAEKHGALKLTSNNAYGIPMVAFKSQCRTPSAAVHGNLSIFVVLSLSDDPKQ